MYKVTILILTALTGSCLGETLTSQLLKQATDTLIDPLLPAAGIYQEYARVPDPSSLDLLVRRLQVGLEAQIEDNWRALNEPQRWAILRGSEPIVKIIKSFQKIKEQVEELERNTEVFVVEGQLNNLQAGPYIRQKNIFN